MRAFSCDSLGLPQSTWGSKETILCVCACVLASMGLLSHITEGSKMIPGFSPETKGDCGEKFGNKKKHCKCAPSRSLIQS